MGSGGGATCAGSSKQLGEHRLEGQRGCRLEQEHHSTVCLPVPACLAPHSMRCRNTAAHLLRLRAGASARAPGPRAAMGMLLGSSSGRCSGFLNVTRTEGTTSLHTRWKQEAGLGTWQEVTELSSWLAQGCRAVGQCKQADAAGPERSNSARVRPPGANATAQHPPGRRRHHGRGRPSAPARWRAAQLRRRSSPVKHGRRRPARVICRRHVRRGWSADCCSWLVGERASEGKVYQAGKGRGLAPLAAAAGNEWAWLPTAGVLKRAARRSNPGQWLPRKRCCRPLEAHHPSAAGPPGPRRAARGAGTPAAAKNGGAMLASRNSRAARCAGSQGTPSCRWLLRRWCKQWAAARAPLPLSLGCCHCTPGGGPPRPRGSVTSTKRGGLRRRGGDRGRLPGLGPRGGDLGRRMASDLRGLGPLGRPGARNREAGRSRCRSRAAGPRVGWAGCTRMRGAGVEGERSAWRAARSARGQGRRFWASAAGWTARRDSGPPAHLSRGPGGARSALMAGAATEQRRSTRPRPHSIIS